jgi:hypothetical protein
MARLERPILPDRGLRSDPDQGLVAYIANDKAAFKAALLKAKNNRELLDALREMAHRGEVTIMEVEVPRGIGNGDRPIRSKNNLAR